jgi:hypothetical protein
MEYAIKAERQRILQRVVEYEALAKQLLQDAPRALLSQGRTAASRPNVSRQETDALRDKVELLGEELKFKLLEWCAYLPGMTTERLATFETGSLSNIITGGLDGFVGDECLNELVDTAERVIALASRVGNIEPARGLSRPPGGFKI